MSVSLTNNFLANARGITLTDGGGIVWSINKATNAITGTVSGASGGTVTSVGLADGSGTPLYTITGSPVTVSGNLTFTLKTQNANLVLAGPSTGGAAQPTFRALATADLPSYGDSSFTVTGTGFAATAPTGTAYWARYGNIVVLNLPAFNGTSNSTSFGLTGLPAAIQPPRPNNVAVNFLEDNGAATTGAAQINGSAITFFKGTSTSASWTASGTKGLSAANTVVYQLN